MKRFFKVLFAFIILMVSLNITPELVENVKAMDYMYYSVDGRWSLVIRDDGKVDISSYMGEYNDETHIYIPSVIDGYEIYGLGGYQYGGVSLVDSYCREVKTVVVSDDIKNLYSGAFRDGYMVSIKMPKYVDFFGGGMFSDCRNLKYVQLPENLTMLYSYTFGDCISLEKVNLPESLETIGTHVFDGCDSLKTVVLPDSVTTLQMYAFSGMPNLRSIVIPSTTVNIDLDYELFDEYYTPYLTIFGEYGSVAEQYANEYDINFRPIEEYEEFINPQAYRKERFGVQVCDVETYTAIADATVAIDGLVTGTTDEKGYIFFDLPETYTVPYEANMQITKDDFYSLNTQIKVEKGKVERKYLQTDDGQYHILEFLRVEDNYDLLHETETFYAGDENGESTAYSVLCAGPSFSSLEYRIIQGGEIIQTSESGFFNIDFTEYNAYEKVYIQVAHADGYTSEFAETGVTIIAENEEALLTPQMIEIANTANFTTPDDVAIFSNKSMSFGFTAPVELKFEYCEDGKFAAWVGYGSSTPGEMKELITEFKYAMEGLSDAMAAKCMQKGFKQDFSGWSGSVEASIFAYGEGYIKNGQAVLDNIDLAVVFSGEFGYSWQLLTPTAPPIPYYLYLGGGMELNVVIGGKYISNGTNSTEFDPNGEISLEAWLKGGAGVGIANIIGMAGEGKASGKYVIDFDENRHSVDIALSCNLVFTLVIFEEVIELGRREWTIFDKPLFDSGGTSLSSGSSDYMSEVYNSDGFTVIKRNSVSNLAKATYQDNISVIDANTFPNAMPKMITHNGVPYVFWLADDVSRPVQDRAMLVYSRQVNGAWTAPAAIEDDDTADGYFDIESDGSGIYVVWHDSKIQFADDVSLDEFSEQAEISFAYLNTATDDITVQSVTNNSVMDTTPTLSIAQNNGYIAWMSNDESNIFCDSGTNTIYRAPVVNGVLGTAETIYTTTKPITELCAGYMSGNSHIIGFVLDEDNDLVTIEDRELYYKGINGDAARITNNNVLDSNIRFSKTNNSEGMFWYSDGNINYYTDLISGNPNEVFGEYSINTDRFEILSDSSNAHIIWNEPNAEENDTAQEVYACDLISGNTWSSPYVLTDTGKGSTLPTGYLDTISKICYLKANGDAMDLVVEEVQERDDFELAYVTLGEEVIPDTNMEFSAKIINTGNTGIGNYTAEIFRNTDTVPIYNESGEKIIKVGESGTIELSAFQPPSDTSLDDSYRFELTIDGKTTTYDFKLGYSDVEANFERGFSGGDHLLTTYTYNNSLFDSNAKIVVREGNSTGDILQIVDLGNVTNSHLICTTLNLSDILKKCDAAMLYIELVTENDEIITYNNFESVYVRDELNGEAEFKDVSASYSCTKSSSISAADGTIVFAGEFGSGNYEFSIDNGLTWQRSNTFENVADGIYNAMVRDFENQDNVWKDTIFFVKADYNGDNAIDMLDLITAAQQYGNANPDIDLNGDGIVNLFDLVLISKEIIAAQ